MTIFEWGTGAAGTKRSVGLTRLPVAACVAICGALVSGCASGSATIAGTLVGADGGCLYVRGPAPNGSDRYWIRKLPPGYVADGDGVRTPDGTHIRLGDSVTVSGVLSWQPFERQCAGAQALDATTIR